MPTASLLTKLPGLSTHLWWTSWHRSGAVLPIAFSSTPETVALVSRSGEVALRLSGHRRGVNCVAWSPDYALISTAAHDGVVRLWDGAGETVETFDDLGDSIESVEFFRDGLSLLVAIRERAVLRVDRATSARRTLLALDCAPSRATLSPDGRFHAVATESESAWIARADGSERRELRHPAAPVFSLAWSADGRLATACEDGVVRIFASDGRVLAASEPSPGRAVQVAWTPDGRHLAAGFREGVARVFAADDLRAVLTLENPKEVTLLAFTPDADVLAVGSGRGDIAFWSLGWT